MPWIQADGSYYNVPGIAQERNTGKLNYKNQSCEQQIPVPQRQFPYRRFYYMGGTRNGSQDNFP